MGWLDYYEILGVSPGATPDEITAAYRRRARTFHPDAHPDAGPAERLHYERAMARINEAYSALNDRAQPSRLRRTAPRPEYGHRPTATQCTMCGSEPVASFRFSYQHAYVVRRMTFSHAGQFCRSCAQALGRSAQNRTLTAGWWGPIAFFANFAYAYRNAVQLRTASRMEASRLNDRFAAGVIPEPMSPGRPVFRRAGVWFAAALLTIGVPNALRLVPDQGLASTSTSELSSEWLVGNCVSGAGDLVRPVDCSQSHVGRVIASEPSQSLCPSSTTRYVESGVLYYCIVDTTG